MSEQAPSGYCKMTLIDQEIEKLRSQIAMYLKSGAGDQQGQKLLERAEALLRKVPHD